MTPLELLEHCTREVPGIGAQTFSVLVVPRKHRGERARILNGRPSVFGRVVGGCEKGLMVSVANADLRKWFVAHLSSIEGAALAAAERCDWGEADHMMAQYVAIRDRLAAAGAWGRL